jgi:hypothetical protein
MSKDTSNGRDATNNKVTCNSKDISNRWCVASNSKGSSKAARTSAATARTSAATARTSAEEMAAIAMMGGQKQQAC